VTERRLQKLRIIATLLLQRSKKSVSKVTWNRGRQEREENLFLPHQLETSPYTVSPITMSSEAEQPVGKRSRRVKPPPGLPKVKFSL
jgi:hypothetical protein